MKMRTSYFSGLFFFLQFHDAISSSLNNTCALGTCLLGSDYCRKMGRRISGCLLGIVAFFLIVTFYSMFNIYVESSNKLGDVGRLHSKKLSDYIGISGTATIFPFKCDTCALIGTSGHLRESASGGEIDKSYSCIFRLGFAPTRGYENQVGSRTTARIVDSFRFYPLLKKPLKLVTGPFPSDFWFLFDRADGDITRFHGPLLKDLLQKHDSRFLWFNRKVEKEVLNSLGNKRLNSGVSRISSLWFATRVIEDAGCESLTVYGVPDAQLCKRSLNVSVPSLYWEENSTPVCDSGVDASVKPINSKASASLVPTVAERRMLPKWLEEHFYSSDFKFPSWADWTS